MTWWGKRSGEIFNAQVVMIAGYEEDGSVLVPRYLVEKGRRFPLGGPAGNLNQLHRLLVEDRKTLVFNEDANTQLNQLGAGTLPGTEEIRSAIFVPLVANDRALGMISLQHIDREHAFSDADVRLLETLANSMSVALENARLFDETQRSNAELAEALEQQTA